MPEEGYNDIGLINKLLIERLLRTPPVLRCGVLFPIEREYAAAKLPPIEHIPAQYRINDRVAVQRNIAWGRNE